MNCYRPNHFVSPLFGVSTIKYFTATSLLCLEIKVHNFKRINTILNRTSFISHTKERLDITLISQHCCSGHSIVAFHQPGPLSLGASFNFGPATLTNFNERMQESITFVCQKVNRSISSAEITPSALMSPLNPLIKIQAGHPLSRDLTWLDTFFD